MERRRRLAGYALAIVLAPLFTVSLALLHGQLSPAADVLACVIALIAVIVVVAVTEAIRHAEQGRTARH